MENYDICIIGGGPAGYAAAMRAIDFNKKILLIEKSKFGGAGIYNGALTSKTMWELARKVETINSSLFQKGRNKLDVTWEDVKNVEKSAVFERKFQYSSHIKYLHAKRSDIFDYVLGEASFVDDHILEIKEKNSTYRVSANNIIIASGSVPRKLPEFEIDENYIMTSDGISNLTDYPKSIVIIGAGVIGCEFATIFSSFGRTKVYLIDKADRILPFEDKDISDLVTKNLENDNVIIHSNANLISLTHKVDHVEYEIQYSNGDTEKIQVERALLSVGRIPNIAPLKIENAGIEMSKRGIHIGDDDTQTNIPHIYAVGDVSGRINLVNMGELEGRQAVEKICNVSKERLSYENISSIMFLNPEVAAVGKNEMNCINENIPIRVVKIDYSCIPRAIAMRKTNGFFKIIVTDDEEMKVLGMRAIGEHASSAIQTVALLIKTDKSITELAELVHPHPSIIEGIQEAVRMLLNKSIFKSSIFKDKLQYYSIVNNEIKQLQSL